MIKLILLRHGQSQWNLENRFTGWCDADLTEQGISEAKKAGYLIKKKNIIFNFAFTSFQTRAIKTLLNLIEELDKPIKNVTKAWQLNERHYGALQGLNKTEMTTKHGEKQIMIWRRSFDTSPPPLDKKDPNHPRNMKIYSSINPNDIPDTESLKNTYERSVPYFKSNIEPVLKSEQNVLIAAHGNSLRAICKYLFNISDKTIVKLEIPTGNPIEIDLDNKLKVINYSYMDVTRAKEIYFNK